MAEEQPTAEAIKQRRKREKPAAKNAALGIEKFTIEVAGVFKKDLQRDVHQRLLMNLIAADFETQTKMLRCVTTPYVVTEKVSRGFHEQTLLEIRKDPGDEIFTPAD